MTKHYVALVRHGEYHQRKDTPSALQPYPLTKTGLEQARGCGAEISRLVSDNEWALSKVVYSSPQLRAWQTASEICAMLGQAGHELTISEHPDLSERSVGSAANLTLYEIERILYEDPRYDAPPKGWKSDSDYTLPLHGAESLMQAGERVAHFLAKRMREQPKVGPSTLTLCCGHGASMRHAAFHLGVMQRKEISKFSMYHAKPLLLCYTEEGTWFHHGGRWKDRRKNENMMD